MRTFRIIGKTALLLLVVLILQSCAGTQLLVKPAFTTDIAGTYTLLLYGCKYPADLENLAILVKEGGKYPLEVFQPDFMYKTIKGLTTGQALAEAEKFVRCSMYDTWYTQVMMIPDNEGGIVGYELKPVYLPVEFGMSDVLLTSYSLKDGKVTAYIRPDVSRERELEFSGDRDSDGSDK